MLHKIDDINTDAKVWHIPHSEGGLVYRNAIDRMDGDMKKIYESFFIFFEMIAVKDHKEYILWIKA